MQGVLVFASAAARDAAITAPQEGQFAYLKDTNVTTYYTGSAWTNLDTTGMTNPMTTTGDMVYSSSGSTPARLGIGTTGQVITVAGGIPSWATPSGSAFVGAYAYRTSDLTIGATTDTVVTLPSEDFDTDAFHSTSTNTGRITIPAGKAGKYAFDAYAFLSTSPGAYGRLKIYKNGTAVGLGLKDGTLQGLDGLGYLSAQGSIILNLAVADYVEIGFFTQNSCTCAFAYLSAQYLGA
jgi:hypothetical protein